MAIENKIKNKIDQASGKFKQTVGRMTDNPKLETEGRVQHAVGSMAEGVENMKDGIKRGVRNIKGATK